MSSSILQPPCLPCLAHKHHDCNRKEKCACCGPVWTQGSGAIALAFNDTLGKLQPPPPVAIAVHGALHFLVGAVLTQGAKLDDVIGELRQLHAAAVEARKPRVIAPKGGNA